METLSYSRLAAFKECRRLFYYRYELGLAPKARALPLTFGSAFHAGVASMYERSDLGYLERLKAGLQAINNKMVMALGEAETVEQTDDLLQARELAAAVFERYLERYAMEDFKILAVEPEVLVPIFDTKKGAKSKKFNLIVKPDQVIEREDGIWIKEVKTAKSIDSRYKAKLMLDPQSLLYVCGYEVASKSLVRGVLYDVVVKDLPRPPKLLKNGTLSKDTRQNTSQELYLQEIKNLKLNVADYQDILAYLRENAREYFFREYITFPPEDRAEWAEELWQLSIDIAEARRRGRWYKNPANCLRTGHCSFWQVCTAINKEWVLQEQYELAAERRAADVAAEEASGLF
jgi:hypothetical protein